ncbi:MAG: low molecular weight phosphotyrosine protein phosphatase [Bacilli bacterium]|nr:low molecular weight phosphotyrosine protein phosphatase [Bacilli bacterium]
MIKVIFLCHGNICRSPTAEYVFLDLLRKEGLEGKIEVSSRGASDEEHGNDIYPPAKKVLDAHSIPYGVHHAQKISKKEMDEAEFVLCADVNNVRLIRAMFGDDTKYKARVLLLTAFGPNPRNILDPWFYGNYEEAYQDIEKSLHEFLDYLKRKNLV